MAKYNVHAGHCPAGGTGSGAVGYLNESTEARNVKNSLVSTLKTSGQTVYDCTVNSNMSASNCLSQIVAMCNKNSVDLDISIHLNAGGGTGTEVYYYSSDMKSKAAAISAAIAKALGIKDRGAKQSTSLYVLKNTKSKALLIECCFVDNATDKAAWNAAKCANAIAETLLGKSVTTPTATAPTSGFRYQGHVQDKGWLPYVASGGTAGVTGQSKRLEALRIVPDGLTIEAKAHIQGKGWVDYGKITKDTIIGTVGQSDRLECLLLKGNIEYRVHVQDSGWTAWTKADGVATQGTVGQALRIEAIQIRKV